MSTLPPGFTPDKTTSALPAGFTPDAVQHAASPYPPGFTPDAPGGQSVPDAVLKDMPWAERPLINANIPDQGEWQKHPEVYGFVHGLIGGAEKMSTPLGIGGDILAVATLGTVGDIAAGAAEAGETVAEDAAETEVEQAAEQAAEHEAEGEAEQAAEQEPERPEQTTKQRPPSKYARYRRGLRNFGAKNTGASKAARGLLGAATTYGTYAGGRIAMKGYEGAVQAHNDVLEDKTPQARAADEQREGAAIADGALGLGIAVPAALGVAGLARGVLNDGPLGGLIRSHTGQAQIDAYANDAFARDIASDIAPEDQEAVKFYLEAEGDPAKLNEYAKQIGESHAAPEVKQRALDDIEWAKHLPEKTKVAAAKIRVRLNQQLTRGQAVGLYHPDTDQPGNDDATPSEASKPGYYPRQSGWADREDTTPQRGGTVRRGLNTSARSARRRTYGTYAEGIASGETPSYQSVPQGVRSYLADSGRAIRDREFVNSLLTTRMPDGSPLAIKTGRAFTTPDGHVVIDVNGRQFIPDPTAPPPAEGEPRPGLNTSDYQTVDKGNVSGPTARALQKWSWQATDANGNPIYYNGDLALHPKIREPLDKYLSDSSWWRDHHPGVLRLTNAVKKSILSLSPFHYAQEGTRAVMAGVNPFNVPDVDIADPSLQVGLKNGLVLRDSADYGKEGLEGWGAKIRTAVSKVPGLGKLAPDEIGASVERGLFGPQGFVPRLKAATYLKMARQNPGVPAAKIAETVNNIFGLLNHAALGWSLNQQDWARILALAPDFLEGELRLGAGTLTNPIARRYVATNAITQYLAARIGSFVASVIKNPELATKYPISAMHLEAPFAATVGTHTYKVRSPITDFADMIKEPGRFASYRVAPIPRAAWQATHGTDYEGRPLSGRQRAAQVTGDFAPILLQGPIKEALGGSPTRNLMGGTTGVESALRAFGVEQMRAESPALHTAASIYRQQYMARAPESDAYRSRLQTTEELATNLRTGATTIAKARAMVAAKKITQDQFMEALKWSRENPLMGLTKQFGPPELFEVWKSADTNERKMLWPRLRSKYLNLNFRNTHPNEYKSLAPQFAAARSWAATHFPQ